MAMLTQIYAENTLLDCFTLAKLTRQIHPIPVSVHPPKHYRHNKNTKKNCSWNKISYI